MGSNVKVDNYTKMVDNTKVVDNTEVVSNNNKQLPTARKRSAPRKWVI